MSAMLAGFIRAFSTLGCVGYSLKEIRDLVQKHRIDCVELRGFDGSIDVPERLANSFRSPDEAAAYLRTLGLRICALDTSLRLIGSGERERDAFLQFVPWAEAMGVARLRVFDGGRETTASESEIDEAAESVHWWRKLREKNEWKVDIMIETHSSIRTTPTILKFLDKTPAGTGILWDSHHTWRLGGEVPMETWRAIRPHVVHIHVKDSVATPNGPKPYVHTLCGEGEFPMADLLAALGRDGYSGPVSLEWENQWHKEMPPLEDALNSAARHSWW